MTTNTPEISACEWKKTSEDARGVQFAKHVPHGIHDAKGREIGSVARVHNLYGYWVASVMSARNGEMFGALTPNTQCADEAEAKRVADEKIAAARKRAQREAAKGIVRGAK